MKAKLDAIERGGFLERSQQRDRPKQDQRDRQCSMNRLRNRSTDCEWRHLPCDQCCDTDCDRADAHADFRGHPENDDAKERQYDGE